MDESRWDDFRYFLAVAKTSSIKQASVELKTTQSAVSKKLDRLERALKTPLVERGPQGTRLTFQGERILSHALSAEHAFFNAAQSAQEAEGRMRGDCSMRVGDGLANYWLAQFLPAFFDRYPNIELKMMLDLEEKTERNELFDLRLHYMPPADTSQIAKTLCTIHFIPFASKDYIARHGAPKTVDDLADHRLMDQAQYLVSKGTWSAWFSGATDKNTALFTNQSTFLARAVRAGVGIGLMPTYMVLDDSEFVPLDIGLRLPIKLYASYRREQTLKYPVRATLNYLRECVFSVKEMPWFSDQFVAPDPSWRIAMNLARDRSACDAPIAEDDLLAAQ